MANNIQASAHPKTEMRVALVYDRVAAQGGAERVLQSLHKAYPDAPLFTSIWNKEEAPWSSDWDIRTSWLQFLPSFLRRYRWWGWIMPLVFESFSLREFDVVISVTGEAAKAVITQPHQLHICYMLTPTRYLWQQPEATMNSFPRFMRPVIRKVIHTLQKWDVVLAQRPDVIVPISGLVGKRVQETYGLKPQEPIYPPLTQLPPAIEPLSPPRSEFAFTWGRHVAYKQFDTSIQAAIQEKIQLIVAGVGPETARLEKLAAKLDPRGDYVHFVGRISDSHLHWYLQHAQVAVFPQIEDYGISVGEAVMVGCRVIAHQNSGVAEILSQKHGILIVEDSISATAQALRQALQGKWKAENDQEIIKNYTEPAFIKHWHSFTRQAWREYKPQALSIQERKTHV